MRVFVTGSTGLLGSALLRLAPKEIIVGASYNKNTYIPNVQCAYYHVDITKKQLVAEAFNSFEPDIVIHTAAIATPDYCDKHPEEAQKVNVGGTKNIVATAKTINAKIIYITTNGVYDGRNPPYDELSKTNPIDVYGRTKVAAEEIVFQSPVPFIIFRLITLYGWNNPHERQNPLTWQLKLLGEQKKELNMANDMFNNFLSAEEAAKAIWKGILLKKTNERYNIAGADCISRYDFSMEIADVFGQDSSLIHPVPLSFFKNVVDRPKNTCFVTTKMQNELKQVPLSSHKGLMYLKENPLVKSVWREI